MSEQGTQMMSMDRASLLRQGTLPEWIGLVSFLVGAVIATTQLVSSLEARMVATERMGMEQFSLVSNGLEKLQITVDTQARINALERTQELSKFESALSQTIGRTDRLYENIDIAWNHIRESEGKIRQLREEVSKLEIKVGREHGGGS